MMGERHFRPRPFGQAYRIAQGRRRSMVGEMSTAQWERVFTSRKRTMMQKASDLEMSTQCEVTLTIKSPAGQVWYYATSDQLRQKLANGEVIDSTSFRVTRETLENNIIPTPENVPHSDLPQQTISPHHNCMQPGQVSPSSRTDHCPSCQANRSNLLSRKSQSPGDNPSLLQTPVRDRNIQTPVANGEKKKNPSEDQINSTSVRDKWRPSTIDENCNETVPAIPNFGGKKTKKASVLPQPSKAANTNQPEASMTKHAQIRPDTKNTPKGSKENRENQKTGGKKKKVGVSHAHSQNKNHIIFSESEDDSHNSKSGADIHKARPLSKRPPKQQKNQKGKKLKQANVSESVPKNDGQTERLTFKKKKTELEKRRSEKNSSSSSQKPPRRNGPNILGFARFPFQPPQNRFMTERELEEERKHLPSRPPENPTPPKAKTTTMLSDSSSSTSMSSSDSSSSSDDSSDEDESSSTSSSSSSSDESQISSQLSNAKSPRSLQSTTTVETVESSVESNLPERSLPIPKIFLSKHKESVRKEKGGGQSKVTDTSRKSSPIPKIFLSKYEESVRKQKMQQTEGSGTSGNSGSFIKVEKNPYDFLSTPTKTFPTKEEKNRNKSDDKEKHTNNPKSKNTTDKKTQGQKKSGKVNHARETPPSKSSDKQAKIGKATNKKKGDAKSTPVKTSTQASHTTIKQEYEPPKEINTGNVPGNNKQRVLFRGDSGKAVDRKKVKSLPQNSKPNISESIVGKGKKASKPVHNVRSDAEKLFVKNTIPMESRKRCSTGSSNSSFKKARCQTPDNTPLHHPDQRFTHFRRNSESWSNPGWQEHSYQRGRPNFRSRGINSRYNTYSHRPGQHGGRTGMSRSDFQVHSQSMDRGRHLPHNIHSQSALPMQDTVNSTPVRPLLSAEALSSLPGFYPLRRQNSTTSLDGNHMHTSFGGDYYDTLSYRSYDPNSDYELDDFEKQLKEKCFSLRDNPPKYQRFNENVGDGMFPTGAAFRNPHLDRNLRNLSESPSHARGRSRSLSNQRNKHMGEQNPNKKTAKSPNRKPTQRGKPQRPPKRAVAKVKPFNQARNNGRRKLIDKK